jgi:hypothetical protein
MTAKKKAKGASGPSGVNLNPRYTLRATQEEFDVWEDVAAIAGVPLNQWIRDACNQHADWEPPAKRKAKKRP